MIRPLEGITILDLSSILMVPYCTRILADLGADVIKIESLVGDNTRYIGPYENKSMGAVFLNLNRNKKSVSVDLKTLKGKEIIFKLIKKSDVFISNIRKSALSRLGFDHKTFVKYNDKIITNFGLKEFLSAGYTKEINLASEKRFGSLSYMPSTLPNIINKSASNILATKAER